MNQFIHGNAGDWLINMSMVETIYIDDLDPENCFIVVEFKRRGEKQISYENFGSYYDYGTVCNVFHNLIEDINDNNKSVYYSRH